jgi:hypothetical protein
VVEQVVDFNQVDGLGALVEALVVEMVLRMVAAVAQEQQVKEMMVVTEVAVELTHSVEEAVAVELVQSVAIVGH